MVAIARDSNERHLSPREPVERFAAWLPFRPGGYRVFFRTAEDGRVPVSVVRNSLRDVTLEIEHPVDVVMAQPIVLVCGLRRIMGSVQRTTPTERGTCRLDVALIWCSMATRQRPLTADHEVLLSC